MYDFAKASLAIMLVGWQSTERWEPHQQGYERHIQAGANLIYSGGMEHWVRRTCFGSGTKHTAVEVSKDVKLLG